MDKNYNVADMQYSAENNYKAKFSIPENATAKELKEFDEYIESLQVNPGGLIAEAFERIFNEPFDDGSEDEAPNEQETGTVD